MISDVVVMGWTRQISSFMTAAPNCVKI